MESIENILSRQCVEMKFRNGKVEYFSLSTQWDEVNTLEEALTNIIETDTKYDGKTPLTYAMERKATKNNVKKGYWEQGDMYDIGDVCSLCGYDSGIEPCYLSHCPICHAEMTTL